MNQINLTTPEWAFLDGHSHLGDTLKDRTMLQHIRSYTMMEIFALQELTPVFKLKTKNKSFTYTNQFGIVENHIISVHFSLAENNELDDIVAKAITFYCDYLAWEDKNINNERTSKLN